MPIRPWLPLSSTWLLLFAAGCEDAGPDPGAAVQTPGEASGEDSGDAPGDAAPNPLGFAVWHADFPGAPAAPDLSPRRPGLWYDRTRRQALETVVQNLSGGCTKDAWWLARQFFTHLDPADADALIVALDRALQVPAAADHAENIVAAIGAARIPQAAEALLRALEHPRQAIRTKVMGSLIGSGTADAVRQARSMFPAVDGRGIDGWIKAAVAHLPPEEVAAHFAQILQEPRLRLVRENVVAAALRLPAAHALAAFESFIGEEPPDLIAPIAVLRHINGDGAGTSLVADLLRRPEPQSRIAVVEALRLGGAEELLDGVLRLTTDPDPTVRLAVVQLLAGIESEHVGLALESMATDEALDVRRAVLAELARRGGSPVLDELVDTIRSGTGSRLLLAMEDLIAARYGGAVPALAERMRAAPGPEKLDYLRAIALTTAPEAVVPLRELFLADTTFAEENREQIAYYFANVRGAEGKILELFHDLPKDDYRRRALLLGTLANVASEREDPAFSPRVYELMRSILADREEIPQMRLSALDYLRRKLRLDDVMAIKRMAPDESEPMRKALTDFLFEFF